MARYFTRTGLIVLISVVIFAGAGSAYAGIVFSTITLGGNVDVLGEIAIRGGSPGAGKVLTDSDGAGTAEWQTIDTEIVTNATQISPTIEGMTSVVVEAFCAPGQVATGGGCDFNGEDFGEFALKHSTPLKGTPESPSIAVDGETPTGWACKAVCSGNDADPDLCNPEILRAFVVCLDIGPTPPLI